MRKNLRRQWDHIVLLLARRGIVSLRTDDQRFRRVRLLKRSISELVELRRVLDLRQGLYVAPDGRCFVASDGVLLDMQGSNRYLKVSGADSGNEGSEMHRFLAEHGVSDLRTVVDVGANVGEVSLYFARHFPSARIVAIEPSPRNLMFLRENIATQFFAPNIEIAEVAVAARPGDVWLSDSGASSTLKDAAISGRPDTARGFSVSAVTLRDLFSQYAIESADFVKIDIEGSEVDLIDDLDELAPRARAWLIECAHWNEPSAFAPILRLFARHGFAIQLRGGRRFQGVEDAVEHLTTARGGDFWFIRQ